MESTKDSSRSLSTSRALRSAGRAYRRHEPLHEPLRHKPPRHGAAAIRSVAANILFKAVCTAFIVTAAHAQDPAASGQSDSSRDHPVKVLPGSPDNVPGPSISASDL